MGRRCKGGNFVLSGSASVIRRHGQAKTLASGTGRDLGCRDWFLQQRKKQTQGRSQTSSILGRSGLSLLTYRCPPALLLSYSTSPSPPAHQENTFIRFGRPSFIGQIELVYF
jgi:hypothetical protein